VTVARRLEQARNALWFLRRPRLYPQLLRLAGAKLSPPRSPGSADESRAWCAERARSGAEVLGELGGPADVADLRRRFPEVFAQADAAVREARARLGGAGELQLLYGLCELTQATRVIETGVAYGWSTLALLLSLEPRGGLLVSTDMPSPGQPGGWVGCAVPTALRGGWRLIDLPDREGLPRALKVLPVLDLAHYDSDKSWAGRRWAYPQLWSALRPGGIFVSDDIQDDVAFRDFAAEVGVEPRVVRTLAVEGDPRAGDKYVGVLVK
jgi:predicted O-methyltransferase YrrM